MSFYRKYRPQIISEIDNLEIREKLLSLLRKKRQELPHGYLLTGPKGTGKTTAARIIAKLFNCENPSAGSGPCGRCPQCTSIANGSHLDVLEIDAASNRGIDEIRLLRERINLAPVSGKYKVYIIDEVHMLTTEAFNALLKTLEEPPLHAVFVLATTDPQKVPATITSRCTLLPFHRAFTDELLSVLNRIVRKEKIKIDKEALTILAGNAEGSFRDATKMLEQVSFSKGKITVPVVRKLLSLSEEKRRGLFLDALDKANAKEAISQIEEMVQEGVEIKNFLVEILTDLETRLVDGALGKSTEGWDQEKINLAIRKLMQAYTELKLSPIAHLPLELAVIEFCRELEINDKGQVTREGEEKQSVSLEASYISPGLLTLGQLVEHWPDFIAATKPFNHSVAGVLRSSRPKSVEDGVVTIEAFYKFHQEKLSEGKTKQLIQDIIKKLFGEKVRVEIVLGKK